MHECLAYMYVCEPCAQGGQMRVSYPLKLELQMFVSHLVGAGDWIQPCARAAVLLTAEQALEPHNKILLQMYWLVCLQKFLATLDFP